MTLLWEFWNLSKCWITQAIISSLESANYQLYTYVEVFYLENEHTCLAEVS